MNLCETSSELYFAAVDPNPNLLILTKLLKTGFAGFGVEVEESNMLSVIGKYIDRLQRVLNYTGWKGDAFQGDGLGKIGTTGFLIGLVCGISWTLSIICSVVLLSGLFVWNSMWYQLIFSIWVRFFVSFVLL